MVSMSERTIVQITGEAGAGKTDMSAYLAEKYDFTVITVSDIIRSFAYSKGIVPGSRSNHSALHTQMKKVQGPDCVAETILANPASRLCVDGIRVANDVERLRKTPNTIGGVIALDCPTGVRLERAWQRALQREPALDKRLFERQFLEDDRRESYNPDPECPNILAVMEAADFHVDASQPPEVVHKVIDRIVVPILRVS